MSPLASCSFVLSIVRAICFYFYFIYLFPPYEQSGGGAARLAPLFSFPCPADHEQDRPPCKVVLLGW